MEKQISFTVLFIFFIAFSLFSQSTQFDKANKSFQDQDYASAIATYEEILASGLTSPELHYNLALCYFHMENWAKSRLQFEKALKLNPGFKEAQSNITLIKSNLEVQITPIPKFFLSRWWNRFINLFSPSYWAMVQVIFFFLTIYGVGLWLLGKHIKQRKQGFYLGILSVCFLVLSLLAGHFCMTNLINSEEGIIMNPQVSLLTAPDEISPTVSELSPGVKVFIEDELTEWYKVSLEDREQGWIRKEWMEKI